jgi:putative ABC transport system ATP-binding protein
MLALRGMSRQHATHQAEAILSAVGLGDKCNSLPRDLSGGQKQRVAIARALAGNPPLVLADEPTSALDAENGRSISILMKNLCRERGDTVVVVTHDDRIFDLADRIVRIEDGRIVHGAA